MIGSGHVCPLRQLQRVIPDAGLSGGGADVTERLAPTRFEVAGVQNAARIVEEDGPIIFPGLNTTTGERTLVLDHQGDDPTRGWRIYYAHPIDRPDCPVEQVIGTREFIDCDGTTIGVEDLSPPNSGVFPVVENQQVRHVSVTLGVRGQAGGLDMVAIAGLPEGSTVLAGAVGPLREGTQVRLNVQR